MLYTNSMAISQHLALPLVHVPFRTLGTIKDLASRAEVNRTQKCQLEALMLKRPTVCTESLGRTAVIQINVIQIKTSDEIPVRKRAYPVSIFKQQFIDQEVSKCWKKG